MIFFHHLIVINVLVCIVQLTSKIFFILFGKQFPLTWQDLIHFLEWFHSTVSLHLLNSLTSPLKIQIWFLICVVSWGFCRYFQCLFSTWLVKSHLLLLLNFILISFSVSFCHLWIRLFLFLSKISPYFTKLFQVFFLRHIWVLMFQVFKLRCCEMNKVRTCLFYNWSCLDLRYLLLNSLLYLLLNNWFLFCFLGLFWILVLLHWSNHVLRLLDIL